MNELLFKIPGLLILQIVYGKEYANSRKEDWANTWKVMFISMGVLIWLFSVLFLCLRVEWGFWFYLIYSIAGVIAVVIAAIVARKKYPQGRKPVEKEDSEE